MKKTMIALIVSTTAIMTNAASFQIIIDKSRSNYEVEVIDWVDDGINYTNWTNIGSTFNCETWTPQSTTQLDDYGQSLTCDQNQERKKQYMEKNVYDGSIRVAKEEIESQKINTVENRTVSVVSEAAIQQGASFDCNSWTPLASDTYYGVDISQNRNCSANMNQDYVHTVETNEIHRYTNTYIEAQKAESQLTAGTKKHTIHSKSCGYDRKLSGECFNSSINTTYYSSGTGRGWAILVLDPNDFSAKNYNRFDTHGDPTQSNNMATMINNVKNGDLVIISTYDQPSYINSAFVSAMGTHLKANTTFLNELVTLGHPNSDEKRYRSSYSLISYKNGEKIAEDYGYRYEDSEVSALLPR